MQNTMNIIMTKKGQPKLFLLENEMIYLIKTSQNTSNSKLMSQYEKYDTMKTNTNSQKYEFQFPKFKNTGVSHMSVEGSISYMCLCKSRWL